MDDLLYLDELVETSSGYSRRNLTENNHDASKVTYGATWDVVERGTMYIKIDDDIVSYNSSPFNIVLQSIDSVVSMLTSVRSRCSLIRVLSLLLLLPKWPIQ